VASAAPRTTTAVDLVCYDGDCGMCHGAVKRLVRWDRDGSRFSFAPLGGPTATTRLGGRGPLPDSIVVLSDSGEVWSEFAAVRRIAERLGDGGALRWKLAARLLRGVPDFVGNLVYRAMARIRRQIAPVPDGACPLLPPDLARRFKA